MLMNFVDPLCLGVLVAFFMAMKTLKHKGIAK